MLVNGSTRISCRLCKAPKEIKKRIREASIGISLSQRFRKGYIKPKIMRRLKKGSVAIMKFLIMERKIETAKKDWYFPPASKVRFRNIEIIKPIELIKPIGF